MRNEFYRSFIMQLPKGLFRFVAETIMKHEGKNNAITRRELVRLASENYPNLVHIDRAVRLAITDLREHEWIIGMSHSGDGYFLCSSRDEYEQFKEEYAKRAYAVLDVCKKMDKVADRTFGPKVKNSKQLSLIN